MTDSGHGSVRELLRKVGMRLKATVLVTGMLWWLVVSLGVWLVLFLLDNVARLPPGIRFPCAIGGLAVVIYGLTTRVCRPGIRPQTLERTARTLEARYAIRDNTLINACQLESRSLSDIEQTFARRTRADSFRRLANVSPSDLWRVQEIARWGVALIGLGVVWIVYVLGMPHLAGNAFQRYARPLGDVPPAGRVVITTVPAGEVTLCEGDNLEVTARILVLRQDPLLDSETPVIVWARNRQGLETTPGAVQRAPMLLKETGKGNIREFGYVFRDIRQPFVFRIMAGDTHSSAVTVRVRPVPRLVTSVFRIVPPAYTGRPPIERPGPPANVSCLCDSTLDVFLGFDGDVAWVEWQAAGQPLQLAGMTNKWWGRMAVTSAFPYAVEVFVPRFQKGASVARGEVVLEPDLVPEVDFVTEERNRLASPGSVLELEVRAADDFGVESVVVMARKAEAESGGMVLKEWRYEGPPGRTGVFSERLVLRLSADLFQPGSPYVIEALARDFCPRNPPAKSRPMIVRVRGLDDLSISGDDPLATAFAVLKLVIEEQRRALAATDNLRIHLEEALAGRTLPQHRKAMLDQQTRARDTGKRAREAFVKASQGKFYETRLALLCDGEMALVIRDIGGLDSPAASRLPGLLEGISQRQRYILDELVALLGQIVEKRSSTTATVQGPGGETSSTSLTAEDVGRLLRDELKQFAWEQERILKKSRTLAEKKPEDLTEEEERILGELAREEAEWAKFFEERLTDFSKLPLQDFADKSLATEFNEVFQEVKLAAKHLYEKKIELAVPVEQAGLEKAEKLVHNLERWLSDIPDNLKWLMEEPPAAFDIPLAELPAELEDIVGELLDREEEMGETVEDVTSSWLDSLDKGAGWTAMDGPISDMSAKGVTGNLLPNQQEVGGRSGEGRAGRSHGQMVEQTAEGKEGRETPTRLTPGPFEA
ncbi:MAG: hypothetical protein N2255_09370, partial [Kiritimatiellae bacterium]|nr:hypothetical protein [Kiritimatiellia bacterium]